MCLFTLHNHVNHTNSGLARFLLDGVPLQQNPEMTLMELGVDGSCPLMAPGQKEIPKKK